MPNLGGSNLEGPWKCFHCGETFHTVRDKAQELAASQPSPAGTPAGPV